MTPEHVAARLRWGTLAMLSLTVLSLVVSAARMVL